MILKRLLLVLAHPDDESLGFGGTIAKYANEGVEVFLITATRGERGRFGMQQEPPALEIVGQVREQELRSAAKILGIKEVSFLDYMDGDVDKADSSEIVSKIAYHIRKIKPQIVMSFGADGAYGHPDHIAISQFTTAGIVMAADSNTKIAKSTSHTVSKLYFLAWPDAICQAYQKALKQLGMTVDGTKRLMVPYPEWMITTVIDARPYWKKVWKAISCHETQMSGYANLHNLSEDQHRELWGTQAFYRVFSLVNSGRKQETDIFEGIAKR
jgi:LmbE family N-acetylglucosaminyl deacetylase